VQGNALNREPVFSQALRRVRSSQAGQERQLKLLLMEHADIYTWEEGIPALRMGEASASPFQAIPPGLMGNTGKVEGTKRRAQQFPTQAPACCELFSED